MRVTVTRERVRGVLKFAVSRFINGKRKRSYFDNETDAEEEADFLRQQYRDAGSTWFTLSAAERSEISFVLHEMRLRNLSLREVWESYKKGAGSIVKEHVTLRRAFDETMVSKRTAGRRGRYLDSLESYLSRFIQGREAMPVDRIRPSDIDQWFNSRNESPSTRASNLGRLSAMFDYCYRHDYIPFNPCDKVERMRVTVEMPVIFHRWRCLRLLATCRKTDRQFLPYLILGMLCGLRPEEAEKMKWANIDFKKRRIKVKAEDSKKHHWRFVPLEQAAAKWLRYCRFILRDKPLVPNNLRRRRRRLCDRAGFKVKIRRKGNQIPKIKWVRPIDWEQDVLRKTAASFLMARHGDAQKVSEWLGNSPQILRKHYRQLVSPEEAERFWERQVRPRTAEGVKARAGRISRARARR